MKKTREPTLGPYNKKYHPLMEFPLVEVGECIRSTVCKGFSTDLANGYCQDCWDKGFGSTKKLREFLSMRKRVNDL